MNSIRGNAQHWWTRPFASLSPGRREVLKAALVWLSITIAFPLGGNGVATLFHAQRMWLGSIITGLVVGGVLAFQRLWRVAG